MSKMSELDAVIRDLRTAAAAINDAADTLSEMFSGKTAEAPATPTEPAPTKEDVRAILAEMSSRGFTAQVKEFLDCPDFDARKEMAMNRKMNFRGKYRKQQRRRMEDFIWY